MNQALLIKSEPKVKLEEGEGEGLSLASLLPLPTNSVIKREEKVRLINPEQHTDTKLSLTGAPACQPTLKQLSKKQRRKEKKKRQRQSKKLRVEAQWLAQSNGNSEQPAEPKRSARTSRDLEHSHVKTEQLDHSSRKWIPTSFLFLISIRNSSPL